MATLKQKQIARWQEISGYNDVPQDVKDYMSKIYDKSWQDLMWGVYKSSPTEMTVAQLQSASNRLMNRDSAELATDPRINKYVKGDKI